MQCFYGEGFSPGTTGFEFINAENWDFWGVIYPFNEQIYNGLSILSTHLKEQKIKNKSVIIYSLLNRSKTV